MGAIKSEIGDQRQVVVRKTQQKRIGTICNGPKLGLNDQSPLATT